jgi:very-long-chain ceramide synthase
MLMWFYLIVRVAAQVIRGGPAHEPRSDDEEEVDVEEEMDEKIIHTIEELDTLPPYEEEVGVEAINLKGRTSNAQRYRKSSGSASGVSLPSDRKELLGRIGCDKGV